MMVLGGLIDLFGCAKRGQAHHSGFASMVVFGLASSVGGHLRDLGLRDNADPRR